MMKSMVRTAESVRSVPVLSPKRFSKNSGSVSDSSAIV